MPKGLLAWSLTVTLRRGTSISPAKRSVVGMPMWLYLMRAPSCARRASRLLRLVDLEQLPGDHVLRRVDAEDAGRQGALVAVDLPDPQIVLAAVGAALHSVDLGHLAVAMLEI